MARPLQMFHLNDHQLAAVSIMTTHPDPEIGDIVEVSVLPVDSFQVSKTTPMFHIQMHPDFEVKQEFIEPKSKRTKVMTAIANGATLECGAQLFDTWFDNMKLLYDKRIMPLAYNWPLVSRFLIKWLGYEIFTERFDWRYRDVLPVALFLDDKAWINGIDMPFQKQDVKYLFNDSKIEILECENTATEAKHLIDLYRHQRDIFLGV